jgi:double-stranded uracil-DNA glycosylase
MSYSLTMHPWRPTPQDLRDARNKTVRDLIAPDLKVLFVGINPGLYTAAIGHHFGRPGNRFWPALFAGGITPRLFSPFEESELLKLGYGITNLVDRATATADELSRDELVRGRWRLERNVLKFQPKLVTIVGITAYRAAFIRPKAQLGRQPESIGKSVLWVLPNPSGLNAHHQPITLAKLFRELREAAG